MPAHRQLHGIRNRIARGERGPHPLVPHGDAVGDGDRGELTRGAAALLDALFHHLRLPVQRDVAGGRLVPAGRHAHPGLVNLFLGDAHGVEIAAVRRARRAFGDMAAGKLRLVETLGGHDGSLRQLGGDGGQRPLAAATPGPGPQEIKARPARGKPIWPGSAAVDRHGGRLHHAVQLQAQAIDKGHKGRQRPFQRRDQPAKLGGQRIDRGRDGGQDHDGQEPAAKAAARFGRGRQVRSAQGIGRAFRRA